MYSAKSRELLIEEHEKKAAEIRELTLKNYSLLEQLEEREARLKLLETMKENYLDEKKKDAEEIQKLKEEVQSLKDERDGMKKERDAALAETGGLRGKHRKLKKLRLEEVEKQKNEVEELQSEIYMEHALKRIEINERLRLEAQANTKVSENEELKKKNVFLNQTILDMIAQKQIVETTSSVEQPPPAPVQLQVSEIPLPIGPPKRQPMRQPTKPSVRPSIDPPMHQPMHQPLRQPMAPPTYSPMHPSMRATNQVPMGPPIGPPIGPPMEPPMVPPMGLGLPMHMVFHPNLWNVPLMMPNLQDFN